jgi:hypothetical protein
VAPRYGQGKVREGKVREGKVREGKVREGKGSGKKKAKTRRDLELST